VYRVGKEFLNDRKEVGEGAYGREWRQVWRPEESAQRSQQERGLDHG
jgi:hypothetical protein